MGHPAFLGPLRNDADMQTLQTDQTVGLLVVTNDAEQWASRIRSQCQRSVASIIDLGRVLIAAKAALSHGEWGRLFTERLVPMCSAKAVMLMAIARHPV